MKMTVNSTAPMQLISSEPDFGVPVASVIDQHAYADKMIRLFGNCRLPAIVYKGEMIAARML